MSAFCRQPEVGLRRAWMANELNPRLTPKPSKWIQVTGNATNRGLRRCLLLCAEKCDIQGIRGCDREKLPTGNVVLSSLYVFWVARSYGESERLSVGPNFHVEHDHAHNPWRIWIDIEWNGLNS